MKKTLRKEALSGDLTGLIAKKLKTRFPEKNRSFLENES
jgi:hypothetical protein